MKINRFFVFVVIIASCRLFAQNTIYLSSLGFLPKSSKKATITEKCRSFSIHKTSNDQVVFNGHVQGPIYQEDVDQTVWVADFSSFKKKGSYYLSIENVGQSIPFDINKNVYKDAYKTAMRAMYLWRCGTAVKGEYSGEVYAHPACHMQDGWLDSLGLKDQQRDGTGGWHDAGDHGKYVVNAGITVGNFFLAWEHFQKKIKKVHLDLPETAPGYPEYLKELKWETDWLLKMQWPDGSGKVSHKLTRTSFSGFIMPEDDEEKRFFTDWSTAAVADFVAMMAMAARYFEPYDTDYANQCLDAAEVSYRCLKENPEAKWPKIRGFKTGGYFTGDTDDRMWAAIEMWETTGSSDYLKDFEEKAKTYVPRRWRGKVEPTDSMKVDENWDWGEVRNMAMFRYVLSKRKGKNTELLAEVQKDMIAVADTLVKKGNDDIYGRPLAGRYYWGCNGTIARQVINLQVAYQLTSQIKYRNTALDAISHLFGRNYYGRSFVTGVGYNPPMHPHDRRSGADDIEAPWPGYIVGGGHSATDWVDEEASFATNEVAINWQAALVYALAGFLP